MRQSGLLLDDNRDVSEACVTRPLVEIDDNADGRTNSSRDIQLKL